eukprot:341303-Prymnesium_polylepis.1
MKSHTLSFSPSPPHSSMNERMMARTSSSRSDNDASSGSSRRVVRKATSHSASTAFFVIYFDKLVHAHVERHPRSMGGSARRGNHPVRPREPSRPRGVVPSSLCRERHRRGSPRRTRDTTNQCKTLSGLHNR